MRALYGSLTIAVLLVLWQGVVWFGDLPHFILPAPLQVLKTWWASRELILEHSLITLSEVVLGLFFGGLFGVFSAIVLAASPIARMLVRPLLVFSQALPVFALAPILNLWFGYGLASKVMMAVLIIYFPITSAFFDGLMRTPQGYLDLAQTLQAHPRAIMWRIRVPAALPALASGVRLAAVYAPIGAVIGEWVGAAGGLGYLMLLANGRAKIDLMFAALLSLGVLAVALYLLADRLANGIAGTHFRDDTA